MFNLVQKELLAIEEELATVVRSEVNLVTDISSHLLKAGGKRLRPALFLLCAKNDQLESQKAITMASAIEMIHMATLVHDDVIDRADTRRGIATANAQWGNQLSVLTGDYLFAKAFSLIANGDDKRPLQVLTEVICKMCEGEILQSRDHFNKDQSEMEYYDRIAKKTACFIAASCELGAIYAGMTTEETALCYQYGYAVGMAFQITDDLLDVTASSQQIGKPAGSDLRQGVVTLPVIYALEHSCHREELGKMIAEKDMSEGNSRRSMEIVHETDAIEYCYQQVEKYLEIARNSLPDSLSSEVRQALIQITAFVGLRKY